MKKVFKKSYVLKNRGCYSKDQVKALEIKDKINLKELFTKLPINDFCWWFTTKCELTNNQLQEFAVFCAKLVLPIFEKKFPNDNRVRECIEYTERFLKGDTRKEGLLVKRIAAYAADAAAAYTADYAAAYAAYAAYTAADAAAAYTADYAADAAYTAAAADAAYAAAAADAAYAADALKSFSESVWLFVESIKDTGKN